MTMDETLVQRFAVEESSPGNKEAQAQPPARKKTLRIGLAVFFLVVIVALGIAVVYGLRTRSAWTAALQQQTNENVANRSVAVVHPRQAPPKIEVDLQGQTQAYVQAPIYAQTTGYLKKWNFDIGSHVKQGDVLGEIDTPQVDQQFYEAKANLVQAHSALELSNITYQRDQDLLRRKVIAQQDFDSAESDLRGKQASVNADQAALLRLQALEDFKLLKAPFAGIVTARNTDIGQIVNAGSGNALFVVSQVDPLRVFINVPESMTQDVQVGSTAELSFSEVPGNTFPGKVVRTAGSIDQASRTLLTEIDVPNPDGRLFAGASVQIHLSTGGDRRSILIPANTLIFQSDGTSVAAVGPEGEVALKKIKIGKDLGTSVEVTQGLSKDDRVILDPAAGLASGQIVNVRPSKDEGVAATSTPEPKQP
jgi:RND family efflux transporter MFP subunit